MKEHPIICSGESVRAILEGTKTQTRRVLKRLPLFLTSNVNIIPSLIELYKQVWLELCPYGIPGDKLWVRETWNVIETIFSLTPRPDRVVYRASPETYAGYLEIAWRSPILMPRSASRITLDIVKVKVERLQEMTLKDAKAEGFESISDFAIFWDKLNAKRGYAWAVNPWVWVIKFRKEDKESGRAG